MLEHRSPARGTTVGGPRDRQEGDLEGRRQRRLEGPAARRRRPRKPSSTTSSAPLRRTRSSRSSRTSRPSGARSSGRRRARPSRSRRRRAKPSSTRSWRFAPPARAESLTTFGDRMELIARRPRGGRFVSGFPRCQPWRRPSPFRGVLAGSVVLAHQVAGRVRAVHRERSAGRRARAGGGSQAPARLHRHRASAARADPRGGRAATARRARRPAGARARVACGARPTG